ncbi:hypothetical protein CB1_001287001 [Camelus ferus]|nr:hypothetical protein CB1_001287001 [Camelus ferus]
MYEPEGFLGKSEDGRNHKYSETSARLLQRKTTDKHISAYGAVAHDTSAQAVILSRDKCDRVDDLLLLEITHFSIGIETPGGITITMISHGISVLTKQTQTFTTCSDNQLSALILDYKVDVP